MGSTARSAALDRSPREPAPPRPKKTAAQVTRDRVQATLWSAYRRRPNAAQRNRLVESYRPYALEIVRRFAQRLPRTVELSDLTSLSAASRLL